MNIGYASVEGRFQELRNRLRARGRQAGDVRQANKTQGIDQLVQELHIAAFQAGPEFAAVGLHHAPFMPPLPVGSPGCQVRRAARAHTER